MWAAGSECSDLVHKVSIITGPRDPTQGAPIVFEVKDALAQEVGQILWQCVPREKNKKAIADRLCSLVAALNNKAIETAEEQAARKAAAVQAKQDDEAVARVAKRNRVRACVGCALLCCCGRSRVGVYVG